MIDDIETVHDWDTPRDASPSQRDHQWQAGKRGITADAALDLAEALGTTAKLWTNLQATYELDGARKRRERVV